MSNRRLAASVLCLAAAVPLLQAQDVFVSGGSSSKDPQVIGFTANPFVPLAGFQSGPGTFLVLSTPDGKKFYGIANSATQPVTVTDNTFETTHSAASFTQAPTGAVMIPDGTRLAVAAGVLHVFDTSTDNEMVNGGIKISNNGTIIDLGVSLDGKLYFTLATLAGGGSQVNSISTASNTIINTLSVLGTATGLTVGPNDMVYVSTQNQILEINPSTLRITPNGTIALNALPTKPALTPDGKYLLAGNLTPPTGSSLILISLATDTVVATFPNLSVGYTFGNFTVLGSNEILSAASANQGFFLINPNNGGPIAVNAFTLQGIPAITALAASNEVAVGTRSTAEKLFFISAGSLYSYDIPSNSITAQQPISDTNLTGGVSFAGAASTGTQPSTLFPYGNNQTITPGSTSGPLVVQALDSTGRPVFGATVTFTSNSGSVIVSPASAVTGANGYAVAFVTATGATGSVKINAVSGTASFNFSLNVGSISGGGGGGDTIIPIAGQGQMVYASSSTEFEGKPLTVQVSDANGNPVVGTTVTFALGQGVGVIQPNAKYAGGAQTGSAAGSYILKTDSKGQAAVDFFSASLALLASSQETTVVATLANSAQTTFYVTTVLALEPPSGYLLKPNQGSVLTGQAGTTLTGAIQVQVLSGSGPPLANVGISLSNGGLDPTKFPSATCNGPQGIVLSSATGMASCDVILGPVLGTGTFTVNFGNFLISPNFQITVTPGLPAVLNIVAGNDQSGNPGQLLPQALIVQVTDSSGNVLGGIPVTFQVLSQGAVTLSNVSSATDQNGRASALATLGNISGAAQVQVNAAGLSATFTVTTVIPESALQKISGDGQSTTISTAFGAPLVVQLVDANGNGVPNAPVTFAVTGGSAIVGTPSATSAPNGQASTTVTAGAIPGTITITATAGNFTATFTLTSLPLGPSNITIVSGASFQPGIAPGGIALITGNNIATTAQGLVLAFNIVGPLPTTLAGVTISFQNGNSGTTYPAPIYYVSSNSGQQSIAVQVPFEVLPGNDTLIITSSPCQSGNAGCNVVTVPANVPITVQQVSPAIFLVAGTQNTAVVVRSDGSYVSATNPAQRGEIVEMYVTGMGLVSPGALTGATGIAGQNVVAQLVVGLNNAGIPFQSATYAPGIVGVYIITFQVPMATQPGPMQPIGLIGYDDAGNSFYAPSTYIPIQ